MAKKDKNICIFADCKEKATTGFKSQIKIIQPQKYCRKHAYVVKSNGAFPRCKIVSLLQEGLKDKQPNVLDSIDLIPEEKQKEVMSGLLVNSRNSEKKCKDKYCDYYDVNYPKNCSTSPCSKKESQQAQGKPPRKQPKKKYGIGYKV